MTNWKKKLTALLLVVLLLAGMVNIAAFAEEEGSQPVTEVEEINEVKPTKVKISGSKYVAKGKKIKLKATVSPAEASQKVTWTSENPSIATVDKKGNVKGVRPGTVKITAKAGSKKASFKVKVMAQPVKKVTIKGAESQILLIGNTLSLKAKQTPDNAAKSFEWESSNPAVATVTKKGVVTAVSPGSVTITAKATDGSKKKASVTLEVKDPAPAKKNCRALLIGEERHLGYNGDYYIDTCTRNTGDMNMMASLLQTVKGPNGEQYQVTTKKDATYDNIRSLIQSTFANTTDNDISLFFIATHGDTSSTGADAGALAMPFLGRTYGDAYAYLRDEHHMLKFETLAYWLEANVKGEVIVIIESCGAGSAIYVGSSEENNSLSSVIIPNGNGEGAQEKSFSPSKLVSAATGAFKSKNHSFIEPNTGELRKDKYYVLAAARHHESSWGSESLKYNYFTKWLVDGAKGSADYNSNGIIDFTELFSYIKDVGDSYPFYSGGKTYYQHVQRYPVGSTYPLFRIN